MVNTAQTGWRAGAREIVAQLGRADGSVTHPHLSFLVSPAAPARDLSDAVHALCAVHGDHPGLAAAAGPLPSTPGQADTEAALIASRHALEMLAKSERRGCATGAVAALVQDWATIRLLLDHAAARFGVEAAPAAFPSPRATAAQLATLGATPASQRAVNFGAQQLLAQHRGMWDLLEARASAREG